MAHEFRFDLVKHYEFSLGTVSRGWSDEKSKYKVQIICFNNCPESDTSTLATLGMSDYALKSRRFPAIQQELLVSANEGTDLTQLAGFLMSFAESLIESERALLRGEVVGPGNFILSNSRLNCIFVTNPSPLPEALIKHVRDDLIFVYLIPIYLSEAQIARERGWSFFEEELERQNPDIWDFGRRSMVF